ncbi:acetyl-CoA carboxylase biotin carboxyl carrier protein subunit [Iodidimonas nitroreducens]|uniref:Biotin carboxyl carrier protein of acetyl-CoA carboxylase n=1 Tax=Iodidimonas nitroreducens TaxID=1236968 RepID=A0A5A7N4A3_9PROT|nr:acetyl-CoA carboxylase biotin carboxyl carrier protein [Iodidimonas nitroreducens]GAK32943.1 biotin carboxyl carrier protein of acetyl-CoA carboxylase [alpha proteobacterium Q-1]GER03113.1 acetyl-CoA carboxylase biotin carboxyl carrier protein subunit [Iodidimonas nitroreducens]
MSKLKDARDLIRELADLLQSSNLSEIEVEDEDIRIRVGRQYPTQTVMQAAVPSSYGPSQAPATSEPASAASAQGSGSGSAAAAPSLENHPGMVPSPMVGTVYLSPEPGAPAFFKVGDSVNEGDTLLIVEAMKVMNPIAAPRSGKILHILVSDSQPVEYGEPLLILE